MPSDYPRGKDPTSSSFLLVQVQVNSAETPYVTKHESSEIAHVHVVMVLDSVLNVRTPDAG
jgi:hypothetical protein